MEITPIYKRVIGLDVHQNKISTCAIAAQAVGTVTVEHQEFGGFKRDRRALAKWTQGVAPDIVVMASTGIHWKSLYAALEKAGIAAWVVNARHIKKVPGARSISPTRSDWPPWHTPRSSRRPTTVTCA